jgi:hypothetical protein
MCDFADKGVMQTGGASKAASTEEGLGNLAEPFLFHCLWKGGGYER